MGLLGLAAATSPSTVTVRSSAGVNGSDRVELIWADGAIQQQWLEVTVKARVVKILRWCAFVLMSGQLETMLAVCPLEALQAIKGFSFPF